MTQPYRAMLSQQALEPPAHEAIEANGGVGSIEIFMMSQAISMKRIADALEHVTDWRFNEAAIRTRGNS